jgi:CrcB protein
MVYVWLAAGGAIGTIGRYLVSGWVVARTGPSPWGTFAVNVIGAVIIGFFLTLAEGRFLIPPHVRVFIAVGILGGFTTFSTLSYETLQLARGGSLAGALLNGAGSLAAGLIAVYIGIVLARLV